MTVPPVTDKLLIRDATVDDAYLIARLNQDVHEPHVSARPDIFKPLAVDDDLINLICERLTRSDAVTFIAEVDGEAVGYAYVYMAHRPDNPFSHELHFAVVDQISVGPAHRSMGIGEALMAKVTDYAREQGAERIVLDVWSFNEAAVRFYERLGFKVFTQRMELAL